MKKKSKIGGPDGRLLRRLFFNSVFSLTGLALSVGGMLFIAILLYSLTTVGHRAFYQSFISVRLSADALEFLAEGQPEHEQAFLRIRTEINQSLLTALELSEASAAAQGEALGLISGHAVFYALEKISARPQDYLDKSLWIPAASVVDQYLKNRQSGTDKSNLLSPSQVQYIDKLTGLDVLQQKFSTIFLTRSDSRLPEMAGIFGAVMGSVYTLLVTIVLAVPLGVASALYLQEFAVQSRMLRLIEVNINNLAAVPSIIFGLLGLGIFINILGMPRSVPLAGGIVLALMTFPTIVIASRQALLAVPSSIREGALSVGATRHQMVFDHILPFALPSMMTGSIIGMAQALGETAPLLMLGMVAFISSAPAGVLDPATALPVQIFLWSDSPERGIVERTAGAILVLIIFLILMNALAVYLRIRFEKIRQ